MDALTSNDQRHEAFALILYYQSIEWFLGAAAKLAILLFAWWVLS